MQAFNLLVVLGPTAAGKTRLAVQLARHLSGEIISADSRQVYRGLDIGSGKDLHEYGNIPYHLIDIVDPGEAFNLFRFQQCFLAAFTDISARRQLPVLAGGTGLYLDAALMGYHLLEVPRNEPLRSQLAQKTDSELGELLLKLKPQQHNTTDLCERDRIIRAIEIAEGERTYSQTLPPYPTIKPFIIGIRLERKALRQRITNRLKQRLEAGLIDEVQKLHENGVSWDTLDYLGLEYRYVGLYLQGKLNKNDLFQKLNSAIHQFAKKQGTWFRRMERKGTAIHWIEGNSNNLQEALNLLEQNTDLT